MTRSNAERQAILQIKYTVLQLIHVILGAIFPACLLQQQVISNPDLEEDIDDMEVTNLNAVTRSGYELSTLLLLSEGGVSKRSMFKFDFPPEALGYLIHKGQYVLATQSPNDLRALLISSRATLQDAMRVYEEEAKERKEAQMLAYSSASADYGFAYLMSFGLYGTGERVPRILLEGHQASVFSCDWNPVVNILATCSHSGTANFWTIEGGTAEGPIVLPHPVYPTSPSQCNPQKTGVSCMAWHPAGDFIATSICDSMIRVWYQTGEEFAVLQGHKNRIVTMQWNRSGTYLLSAGLDALAIAWEFASFRIFQKFYLCPAPMTDIAWMDNDTFALCCHDKTIQIFKLGKQKLQRAMFGHTKEITMIKWHPQLPLLASSSDDGTVKIWSPDKELCICNLTEHTNEVFVIAWNPDLHSPYQLASTSADKRIRLWNVKSKQCLQVLTYHDNAVICADFSPDGRYLVSTCFSQWVCLWDMKATVGFVACCWCDRLDFPAFDLRWNKDGDMLAATLGTKCVGELLQ
ncbi:hypothetical protein M513_09636 [Trichuris suis]|uniref:Uncharacterized protein n=1 Tax=Trichuris suis TaxID=68888 RepID=A0A085LX29_9BILA|nr:hypothetical protein M513_09636 [Trichuris suis]